MVHRFIIPDDTPPDSDGLAALDFTPTQTILIRCVDNVELELKGILNTVVDDLLNLLRNPRPGVVSRRIEIGDFIIPLDKIVFIRLNYQNQTL